MDVKTIVVLKYVQKNKFMQEDKVRIHVIG